MKTKYFVILFAILFILMISYVFFPGNPMNSGNDEIKIYYVDNISDAHEEIIDSFNELHKGKIRVVPIDIPFYKFSTNERKELLIRSLRSESKRIDIFAADLVWVSRFSKWAEPLEKYFSKKEIANFLPKAYETCKFKNRLIASPLYLDVSVMFYRKDLLSEFPDFSSIKRKLNNSITWKDFISLSKRAKFGKKFYIFPADEYEGLICSYNDLVLSADPTFYNNKIDFTKPASIKAAKLLHDLTNRYKISPKNIINFREKNAYSSFFKDGALFLRGWQSFKNDTKNLDQSAEKEALLSVTWLPHFAGGLRGSTIGGWNLMLTKNSSHKKEAVEFMKYFLKKKSQEILYSVGSYLPVTKEIYSDSVFVSNYPDLLFNKKLLDEGALRPKLMNYTKISDILSHFLRLTIAGELSPEEAMKKTQYEISNSLGLNE